MKEYSWDRKRTDVDTTRYILQDLTTGSEEIRLPGSIKGKNLALRKTAQVKSQGNP